MLKEFREFAFKGNVIDLAVGVVIGSAFGKIVDSLVKDVLMPPIGILTGGVDFSNKVVVLKSATETSEAITLNYGLFINALVSFLIVAFAIFMVIRALNRFKKQKEATPVVQVTPSKEVELLTEIRDVLKNR
jgi:large conductance mechanosensitive channel